MSDILRTYTSKIADGLRLSASLWTNERSAREALHGQRQGEVGSFGERREDETGTRSEVLMVVVEESAHLRDHALAELVAGCHA